MDNCDVDILLDEDQAAELLLEVEDTINEIRDGEIEGEYLEF